MFPACGAGRRLGVHADAAAKKSCRDDACVVQDDQLIAAKEVRELQEEAVLKTAFGASKIQQAGSVTAVERPLGDLAGGEMVIEVVQSHREEVYQHPDQRKGVEEDSLKCLGILG
jgi:hypothetical protein